MVTQTGETWELVFSDEFNTPGRSFYPGGARRAFFLSSEVVMRLRTRTDLFVCIPLDDPYWESQDLHAWAT